MIRYYANIWHTLKTDGITGLINDMMSKLQTNNETNENSSRMIHHYLHHGVWSLFSGMSCIAQLSHKSAVNMCLVLACLLVNSVAASNFCVIRYCLQCCEKVYVQILHLECHRKWITCVLENLAILCFPVLKSPRKQCWNICANPDTTIYTVTNF